MVFGLSRRDRGPSPEMQKKLHNAEVKPFENAGMEEHDQKLDQSDQSGVWSKINVDLPDESMRPVNVPETDEVEQDVDESPSIAA
jgi:hypothetical protein